MVNTWFVCIDPADKHLSPTALEQVDFRIQVQPSDPDYGTLQHGGVINWGGQNLVKWKGPFATEAQAKTAQNPQPAPNLKQAAANTASNFVSNTLGLPTLSHTRDLVIRTVKVLVGMALIIVGISSLLKTEGISVPKLPPVVPV
jgi:hypothetical protein